MIAAMDCVHQPLEAAMPAKQFWTGSIRVVERSQAVGIEVELELARLGIQLDLWASQ